MENNPSAPNQAPQQPPVQQPPVQQPPVQQTVPTQEPVAELASQKPKKKKKTGLIVGIVIAILIVGGLLAVYFLVWRQPSPEKAVGGAIEKLVSAKASQKVVFEGTTTYTPTKESSDEKSVVVASKNQFDFARGAEASHINIQFKSGEKTINLNLESMIFADGTIYLRANDLKKTLQDSDFYAAVKTTDLALKAAGSDFSIYDTIAGVEGQWLEIDLGAALGYLQEYLGIDLTKDIKIEKNLLTEAVGCLVTESDKFLSNSDEIAKLYQQNSFLIAKSGAGSGVEKKQNPLYKITLDAAKLSGFVNASISANLYDGFYNCFGIKVEAEPIQMTTADTFANLADYYKNGLFVEIDNNYNITRTYLEGISGDYEIVNDFDITYPSNIVIAKPTEYTSLENIIKKIEEAVKSIN